MFECLGGELKSVKFVVLVTGDDDDDDDCVGVNEADGDVDGIKFNRRCRLKIVDESLK